MFSGIGYFWSYKLYSESLDISCGFLGPGSKIVGYRCWKD